MNHWSPISRQRLGTCATPLLELFNTVLQECDCSIIDGHRSKERQNRYFAEGKTQVKWPDSNHNSSPSNAVDVIAYPLRWNDRERQTLFAGLVLGIASERGIGIIWGGNWRGDFQVADNKYDDMVHFQMKK
jgi:hypothetical protein